jgi:hypothetical protein
VRRDALARDQGVCAMSIETANTEAAGRGSAALFAALHRHHPGRDKPDALTREEARRSAAVATRRAHPCPACGKTTTRKSSSKGVAFCSPECSRARLPIVYRFVCPAERSYVGSVLDGTVRGAEFGRMNARIAAAGVSDWRFEILERLQPGCSESELRAAERRHMIALKSMHPEHGYNVLPPAMKCKNHPRNRVGAA